MTNDKANDRVLSLLPKINRAATVLISEENEHGDIVNSMVERILTRTQKSPEALELSGAMLVRDAFLNGGNRLNEYYYTYRKYNASQDDLQTAEEITTAESFFEAQVSPEVDPEEALIMSEMADAIRDRVSQMSPECITLIKFAVAGLSDAEIAEKTGVSKSAISQRRNTIRQHLAGVR